MIDIKDEEVLTLAQVAKLKVLPRRRNGRRPHVATFYRWATTGIRGVKLEVIRVGGTLCTSTEAVQRFCDRLTGGNMTLSTRPSRTRQRQIAVAEQELTNAGI